MEIVIDLVSDTVTRPDAGMRAAMSEAQVGDEQREGDPTTDRLCEAVSALLGKDASLFLPSGTLCNLVATAVLCRPGEAIIADHTAHVLGSELGGFAAVTGALMVTIVGKRGQYTADDVVAATRSLVGTRAPKARLVWVEQTHNRGGGSVWPVEALHHLADACKARGLYSHMDGARLLNAVAASGVAAKHHAAPFDSVWIDLSKGLGCPAGAVLSGSREFIAEADIWKRRLGGALRQSGVLAAAGLYALDGYEERLRRDSALARHLVQELGSLPELKILFEPVETNIVFVDVAMAGIDAGTIAARLKEHGIRVGVEGETTLRLVTHKDVDMAGIDATVDRLRSILRR
jgi:threonine aldolase